MRDAGPVPREPAAPPTDAPEPRPSQQPALSWLLQPPARRRSTVLALLALPPVPDGGGGGPGAVGDAPVDPLPTAAEVPAPRPAPGPGRVLPRREPAPPAGVVAGPRVCVLDRRWACDVDTLRRIVVGLRAL